MSTPTLSTDAVFIQNEKTKMFIKQVEALKEAGEIKTYDSLATTINISAPSLSNIRGGRANISPSAYKKFMYVFFQVDDNKASGQNSATTDGDNFFDQELIEQFPGGGKDVDFLKNLVKDLARAGCNTTDVNANIATTNKSLSDVNKILAKNNEKLIDNNQEANNTTKELISVIKLAYTNNVSFQSVSEYRRLVALELQSCFALIAKMGVERNWFENEDEGLVILGKCVFVNEQALKSHDKNIG